MSSDAASKTSSIDEQKAIDPTQAAPQTREDKEQQAAAAEYEKNKGAQDATMRVRVYSPFQDYYDGQAFSISAVNDTGPFDILPHHHNFISLLSQCEVVIRTVNKGEQKIIISGGIMHVKADQVIIFLDV